MKLYVLLLICLAVYVKGECTLDEVYGMVGYVCSGSNLKNVPQQLKVNFEFQFLDVSMNQIAEINQDSFVRYTIVKQLFLDDNIITKIGNNTFAQLTKLELIDLSGNKITTLPLDLFSLPSLIQLDANDNNLIDLHNNLKNLPQPVTAPLRYIHLANCGLNKVPYFGILPRLWLLNISSNDLRYIKPQQLSPFCSLETIDLHDSRIEPCGCQSIYSYLQRRELNVIFGLKCATSIAALSSCQHIMRNITVDTADYSLCMSLKKMSIWIWISIGACLFGLLAISYVIYFFYRRRN